MTMLHGITIQLVNYDETAVDAFNRPTKVALDPVDVENVLVGQPNAEEVTNALNLYGKSVSYMLGIPKGDKHLWKGDVIIWGERYEIITAPIQGIEDLVPTQWHKKVMVQAYPAPEVGNGK